MRFQEFAGFAWPTPAEAGRPVFSRGNHLFFYTFTGTKVNRSLAFLLKSLDLAFEYDEATSSFRLPLAPAQLPALFEQLRLFIDDVDFHLQAAVAESPALLEFAKWSPSLPLHYQCQVLRERYFDFDGTREFLLHTAAITQKA